MKQTGKLEQCLQELGYAIVPTKGTSMWPLLQEGKSWVQVAARNGGQLHPSDVILYRRSDGTLVLHRIVRIEAPGVYLLCGDHQWKPEERVRDEQILAVAQVFSRNGHVFQENTGWYRLYRKLWNGNMGLRRCCLALLRLCGLENRI